MKILSKMQAKFCTQKIASVVVLKYNELVAGTNLRSRIEEAYGPQGTCAIIQDLESSLFKGYLTSLSRGSPLFLFIISWPTSLKKP